MQTLLFLHGWGGDENSFAPIRGYFENEYRCLFFKFDCNPSVVMTLEDYADAVATYLRDNSVKRCFVIAHSFGARVAVILANRNPELFKKIVLTGAAGLRPRFCFKTWLKIRLYKITGFGKGSADWQKLGIHGRQTFQNVIRRDLSSEITRIYAPVLLIWGMRVRATPKYMAKRWTKLVVSGKLIMYKSAGHFCFVDNPARFVRDVGRFLCLHCK